MTSYKILSDNFALGSKGDSVDSSLLEGCNVEALIEAGHLAEVSARSSKQASTEQDK